VQGLAATPGQKAAEKLGQKTEPKFEQKTKARHGLFSFLRKNPPCRGKDCPPQPPCRGKNCKVTCPAGQVASGSACVPVIQPYVNDCANASDPNGRCESSRLIPPCAGPSAAALAAQEQEVEWLRVQRDAACRQAPASPACADLTHRYEVALHNLEELRREAARCRVP
jgi:hypothetical protein